MRKANGNEDSKEYRQAGHDTLDWFMGLHSIHLPSSGGDIRRKGCHDKMHFFPTPPFISLP